MDDTTRPTTTPDLTAERGHRSAAVAAPVGDALPARCRTRFWLALIGTVFAIAGAVLAMGMAVAQDTSVPNGKKDAPPLVIVSSAAALVALHLAMYAYRQARMAAVLRGASWQRSAHSVTTEGRGRSSRDLLHIEGTGLWYIPSNYLGASVKLKRATELEWAGDPSGRVVVRLPDGPRLELVRLGK